MPSVADRSALRYVEETVFGQTPGGPPKFKNLRLTSENLRPESESRNSQEIRSDRQLSRVKRVDLSAAGSVSFEQSYGAYDDWFQAALQSTDWTTSPEDTGSATLQSIASDNSFNESGATWQTDGWAAGMWLKSTGWTDPACNGIFKVSSVPSETKMIVTGGTLVDEGPTAGRQLVQGAEITNGTTLKTYAIEREYTDLTNIFAIYNGMAIDQFALNIAVREFVTGSFTFVGKTETSAAATAGDGSPTAAPTDDTHSAVDDVLSILEGQASQGALSLSFTLNNNMRARTQIGSLGAISVVGGTIEVTGTVTYYFETHALFDKFLNQTESSLAVVFQDQNSKTYVVDFPRVRYTSGQRVAGGQNTDIIAELGFSAYMHGTEAKTIRIARWAS